MTIKDGGIFVAGDTRKINDIQKTKELNCSQDIVLKLTTFEDLMISNGSGPFIDIYKQGSYELTLM